MLNSITVFCAAGLAAATANPYEGIACRNAFNLSPAAVETSKPGDVFKPAPEYKLTGIAGFGSAKWALLSKADPGKAPVNLTLREGQREGSLELVHVDEVANRVRILNDGVLVELTFGTNAPPKIDLVTKKFVDAHTRAHELLQQREAERIARERAEFEAQRAAIEADLKALDETAPDAISDPQP